MINFKDLRSKDLKKKMKEQREKLTSRGEKEKETDERLFLPSLSKDDEENVIDIRFLPSKFGVDGVPKNVSKLFKHSFQLGNKNVYVACPKTIGKECPMCKRLEWDPDDDRKQKVYRQRKAKLTYYTNVYVIDDKQHPENNGTVRILPFGVQLMKAIEDSIKEIQEDDGVTIGMFDLFEEGATFRIRVKPQGINPKTGKPYPNFEKSKFRNPEAFLSIKEAEEIFNKTYDLSEFDTPTKIKTYEEIEDYLAKTFGMAPTAQLEEEKEVVEEVSMKPITKERKKPVEVVEEEIVEENDDMDDMDDDDLDSLINEMD